MPMLSEEEIQAGLGGRQTSSQTILATVLDILPATMPPPVPMEMSDDGVHRRPADKDSFGSLRELVAPPAVGPLIQPPAQKNESVPDEMDTGPPPLTFIDSVGWNRPLAQVVASVPPSVPPAQYIESPPDATDAGPPQFAYMDSVSSILATVVESAPPSTHLSQNNESASAGTDSFGSGRPSYKASLCCDRSSAAATTAVVRPPAQNDESASDRTDSFGSGRPTYKASFDSGRSSAATTTAVVRPHAQNDESASDGTDSFGSGRSSAAATTAAVRPHERKIKTAPDQDEAVRIRRHSYMDRTDTQPEPVASMPPRAPPIANGPQMKEPKEVVEISDTLFEEHELDEDEVESDSKITLPAAEWIQVIPKSENGCRRGTPCMALILVFIGIVVAIAITVVGICGSKGCRNQPVSPQPPPSNAPSNAPQDENTGTSQVSIEVRHDRRPEETGWTLRDRAGEVIASQSAGSFRIDSGTVLQTFVVAVGTYTFEMTDTSRDGICCMNGSGSFQISVNGETVVSDDGQFGDTVQEMFKAKLTPIL
jgi:hypothetical protein